MIYHILNDEKFSDWIINSFNYFNVNGKQRFILISNSKSSNYFKDSSVKIMSKDYFLNEFIPEKDDLIIFYFLHIHNILFLLKRKNLKFKKIWIGYGADYYYYLLDSNKFQRLYLKKTQRYFNTLNGHHFLKRKALAFYQKVFLLINVLPALKTLTHFAPILPNEFSIIKNKFPSLNFEYLDFTFGDLDFLDPNQKYSRGHSVLLGNSATFACNHIDLLDLLKDFNVSNEIIIPLSYGNSNYKKFLLHHIPLNYKSLKIKLISEFLPLKKYNHILGQCTFAIMPHLRQQGMGNIYSLLYSGSKLFLFKKNPVYSFLKDLGICFYSIEELITNEKLLNSPLAQNEMDNNRFVIMKYYSKEKSFQRIQNIFNL